MNKGIYIVDMSVDTSQPGKYIQNITVEYTDIKTLNAMLKKICKVYGIKQTTATQGK